MKNWIEKVNFGLVTHTTNQFRETFLRFLQDDMQVSRGRLRNAGDVVVRCCLPRLLVGGPVSGSDSPA